MSLFDKIDQDMKEALKAGEKERLTVLRGLKSVLKYAQIDKGDELTDAETIAALSSQAKKAKDSIENSRPAAVTIWSSTSNSGLRSFRATFPNNSAKTRSGRWSRRPSTKPAPPPPRILDR